MDNICSVCREKLRTFHEYFKFVLENQKDYKQRQILPALETHKLNDPEFIGVTTEIVKAEPLEVIIEEKVNIEKPEVEAEEEIKPEYEKLQYHDDGEWKMEEDAEDSADSLEFDDSKKKKKYLKLDYRKKKAIYAQQGDLIGLLFDFECDFCSYQVNFKSYRGMLGHMRGIHRQSRSWKRFCCGQPMNNSIDVLEHILTVHKDDQVKCQKCEFEAKSPLEVWYHIQENKCHVDPLSQKIPIENPFSWLKPKLHCDLCTETFRTRTSINLHMKRVHTNKVKCMVCPLMFANKKDANKHHNEAHADHIKIPCPICRVMIYNKPYLMTAHIKNIHESQQMICAQCGKVCNSDRTYRSHMNRAHRPPKHKCQYCDKMFKSKPTLQDHEAVHTGVSRYFCAVCGAQFKSLGNYSAHKRKLHPLEHEKEKMEREAKKYQM